MNRITQIFTMALVLTGGQLFGQTLQLPEFIFTTVSTTVTAPDGGTVLLGSINRVSEGSNERGVPLLGKVPGLNRLFKNRGIGREVSASNFTVTPRIIILEEEEERQVGRPLDSSFSNLGVPSTGGIVAARERVDPVAAKAMRLSGHIARTAAPSFDRAPVEEEAVGPSPEEIRRQNELAAAKRETDAQQFFQKAELAVAQGRTGSAKIYYNMAARRSSGAFRDRVLSRLESLTAGQESVIKSR